MGKIEQLGLYEVYKCLDCKQVWGCKYGNVAHFCVNCPCKADCSMHHTAVRKLVYCEDCKNRGKK